MVDASGKVVYTQQLTGVSSPLSTGEGPGVRLHFSLSTGEGWGEAGSYYLHIQSGTTWYTGGKLVVE